MRNIKKIILSVLLLIVILTQNISAASGNAGIGKPFLTSGGFDVIVPDITIDGEVGYCLNFDLEFPVGNEYDYIDFAYQKSPELRGALFYGFNGGDNSLQTKWNIPDEQARYATNVVIWRHAHNLGIPSNSGQFKNLSLKNNAHPNLLSYLEELSEKRFEIQKPISIDFSGKVKIQDNFQISDTITLSKNIDYNIEVKEPIEIIEKDGATFKVRAPIQFVGEINLKVIPNFNNFQSLLWRTKDNKQDIIQFKGDDPLPEITQKIKFTSTPDIFKIKKINTKQLPEKGVVFEISKDYDFKGEIWQLSPTNINGETEFTTPIDIGSKYYIREKSVPKHLVKSDEIKTIVIEGGKTHFIEFKNEIISGEIQIRKVAEHNSNEYLKGAVFELRRDGKLIDTKISNNDGIVLFKNIEYGNYKVLEIKAPDGYNLNSQKYPVYIGKNKEVIEIVARNEKIPSITTNAFGDGHNSQEKVEPSKKNTIYEKVKINDLVTGQQYRLLIEGIDPITKKVIVKKEHEFQAENTFFENKYEWVLSGFDYSNGIVFKERLERQMPDLNWQLKTIHNENLDDKNQTIQFKKHGKVHIYKIDSTTKEKIKRYVKFGLYRNQQLVEEKASDTGEVEFSSLIEDVEYEIKELDAPLGYIKSNHILKVKITESNQDLFFEYENTLYPSIKKSTDTSDSTSILITIISSLISIAGLYICVKMNK